MWIHVPLTFCPSAVAWADSNSGSDLLYQTLAQSLMWKAKHMRPQFWQSACEKTPWIARLFGQIYEPLTAARGVEKWIASLADIRANLSAVPDTDAAKMTRDTCGQLLLPLSEPSIRPCVSLKTSEDIYHLDLSKSPESYATWAIRLKRGCLQRRKQAQAITENDSSYWPTTTTMDAVTEIITPNDKYVRTASGNIRRHTKTGWSRSLGLARTAKMWPTILASAGVGPSTKEVMAGDPKKRIDVAIQLWRTPLTSDSNGGVEEFVTGKNLRLNLRSQANTLYPCGRQDQTIKTNGAKFPHTLNPQFCEWLMGWPIGWTEFAPVGMALSHWRQRMLGELSRLFGIIRRFAPDVENNTNAYIDSVSRATGIDSHYQMDLDNTKTMLSLMKAIIKHENGKQPYTDEEIVKAITC